MNSDSEVMRYFPAPMDRAQSAAIMTQQRALIEKRGWGLWAVDVDGTFAGKTGLAVPAIRVPCMPCVEIGWRLRREFWGRGIACRAAQNALHYGFRVIQLTEIVSFTSVINVRSILLMQRLGFVRDATEDFDHPSVPEDHRLRRHVLYRLKRE